MAHLGLTGARQGLISKALRAPGWQVPCYCKGLLFVSVGASNWHNTGATEISGKLPLDFSGLCMRPTI